VVGGPVAEEAIRASWQKKPLNFTIAGGRISNMLALQCAHSARHGSVRFCVFGF